MKACQVIIVAVLTAGFFWNLRCDFRGRSGMPPGGFQGAVISIVIYAAGLWVVYKAGALSALIP